MAYSVTALFLLIHVSYFALFAYYGVTPMARFNVFSILFYVAMFFVIHGERVQLYSLGTYLEVVAHMTLAAYFVGWDCGFQITLVGISILVFYAEYIGRTMHYKYLLAAPLTVLGMVGYLIALFVSFRKEPPYVLPDNVVFWLHVLCSVVTFVVTIIFLQIFVQLTFHSEELLARRVEHDRLTGLPNRYHLANYLKKVMDEEGLEGYWLAMADIDDFKHINDTYGHNCGDYVLKTLADVIRECGVGEELCRWGGEEFLLVGRLDENGQVPLDQLERLRTAIEEHRFWFEENRLALTITIGSAPYMTGASSNEWINAADKKLYEGKCAGKNRVQV